MNAGDIYYLSLDPIVGHEQRGVRPVLVLTPNHFNRLTDSAIVAPITTGGEFARRNGFGIELAGAGIRTRGLVRCDQIRTVDLQARKAKFVEHAPDIILHAALMKVYGILAPQQRVQ